MAKIISDEIKFKIVDLLKETDLSNNEIASRVGVSKDFVTKLNRKLNIRDSERGLVRPWTQRELYVLKENFSRMTFEQLAYKLERTERSVKEKARRIGLRKREREDRVPARRKDKPLPVRQRQRIVIDDSYITKKPLPK
ncbi:hypothetical protein [Streptococcus pluranimalium]|uniref:hypothetical protein n=1 Tax=Streptococcus pluranimalium TaxID=82348 RepID=UPI0039FDCA24